MGCWFSASGILQRAGAQLSASFFKEMQFMKIMSRTQATAPPPAAYRSANAAT